jgi:hypothetical protein
MRHSAKEAIMTRIRKTLAVLATALTMAGAAAADDTYTRQVDAQLALVRLSLAPDNWTLDQTLTGSLYQGEYGWAWIPLVKGRSYKIVGVCDEDCYDLDLSLYNDSGEPIRTDPQGDALPNLTLRAPYSGYYMVKAPMARCSIGPCKYGVAVFVR